MRYQIQIASTFTHDTKPAIVIQFDDEKYLFGCPEATQRLCNQKKIKLLKLRNIFLSRSHWDQYGGLPGMLLTLQDIEKDVKTKVTCHGHPSINAFFATIRGYRKGLDMDLTLAHIDSNYTFKDSNLLVKAVLVKPILKERPIKIQKQETSPLHDYEATQFICEGPELLGKFDPKAAKLLQVPVGPMYSILKNGGSVTLSDGSVIHSIQVCSAPTPGTKWMIIDCPDESYVTGIVTNPELSNLYVDSNFKLAFHTLGKNVIKNKEYLNWMQSFMPHVKHIIMSSDLHKSPITFTCLFDIQKELVKVNSDVFPLPIFESTQTQLDIDANFVIPEPGVVIDVVPQIKFNTVSDRSTEQNGIHSSSHSLASIKSLTAITLGTGSAIPLKYRNVSSTVVLMPGTLNGYLFDFGEGTLGQLYRHFGYENANLVISNIKAMILSHLHADHHLGFFSVCKQWLETAKEDSLLFVFAPKGFSDLISEYFEWERASGREKIIILDLADLVDAKSMKAVVSASCPMCPDNAQRFYDDLDLCDIQSVRVFHCKDAYAIIMKHNLIGNVAYSGDCRPSLDFAEKGKPCTLLIHECTFENDKQKEAVEKSHSTVHEAITVASAMQTKNLLLTHFSQRYPKMFKLDEKDLEALSDVKVAMAFDSMRIGLDQFAEIHEQQLLISKVLGEGEDYENKDE